MGSCSPTTTNTTPLLGSWPLRRERYSGRVRFIVTTPGIGQQKNGVNQFFHGDWLGSTRYTTDPASAETSLHRYDAFGQRAYTLGAVFPTEFGFGGLLGYQTEYFDAAQPGLGLQYLEQRYYDPAIGRFLTPDPIAFEGGPNLYNYCDSDPVNWIDPEGLQRDPVSEMIRARLQQEAVMDLQRINQSGPAGGRSRGGRAGGSFWSGLGTLWQRWCGGSTKPGPSTAPAPKALPAPVHRPALPPAGATLQPGPHARESIPARGPQRNFNRNERSEGKRMIQQHGCHTCGKTDPGTKTGNAVLDHQPVSALSPPGSPQRLYPHCLGCSRKQGGEIRRIQQIKEKNQKK
jgi:RHS repeat-associated protein